MWLLARPNLPGTPAKPRTRGWIWALVAGAAIVIILPLILFGLVFFKRASTSVADEKAVAIRERVACLNNAREIALAYRQYVDKYGKCPQSFDALWQFNVTDKLLHCSTEANSSNPSYQLFCGTNATDVILREYPGHHHGYGGVIAYFDGHVEWRDAHNLNILFDR